MSRPSDELSSRDFDRVLAVNLRGSFMCAREALRHFIAHDKPGAIVNVSSVHQLIPKPGYLGYSASKGGMQNLTRTLALEYAPRGIRVNGVGPGATVTPINRAWIDDPVKRAQVEEHIPMRRAGDADEMAGVTCFLASDLAAYITGQTIFVDGGLDRKSTRLNSSHANISYAVFCLKKKNNYPTLIDPSAIFTHIFSHLAASRAFANEAYLSLLPFHYTHVNISLAVFFFLNITSLST